MKDQDREELMKSWRLRGNRQTCESDQQAKILNIFKVKVKEIKQRFTVQEVQTNGN